MTIFSLPPLWSSGIFLWRFILLQTSPSIPHAFTCDELMKCWLSLVESFRAMCLAALGRTVALSDISPCSPYWINKGLDHLIKVGDKYWAQYLAKKIWNPNGGHPNFPLTQKLPYSLCMHPKNIPTKPLKVKPSKVKPSL